MAEQIIKPRGTQDIFGDNKKIYDYITSVLDRYFKNYGVNKIDIPTFEETKLFIRSVGESTDIVNKEIYNLESKGEHQTSLRPEFTAGIMRALIENKLYATPDLPLKLGYYGSVYRYERPQKGRYRELHQGGVEFVDNNLDIITKIDCLNLFYSAAKELLGDNIYLVINYLGAEDARKKWREALREFFKSHLDTMCEDCKRRFEVNPLRILDCKVEHDHELGLNAPNITDFLSEEDKKYYDDICTELDNLGIKYKRDPHLVRGLDYYTGIVFELYLEQGDLPLALGAGGQYANLTAELNGPKMEGIGFSFGLDRLLMCFNESLKSDVLNKYALDFFVYSFNKNPEGVKEINDILKTIRNSNYSAIAAPMTKAFGGSLKQAARMNTKYLLLINEDLSLEIKDFSKREQQKISKEEFTKMLSERKF